MTEKIISIIFICLGFVSAVKHKKIGIFVADYQYKIMGIKWSVKYLQWSYLLSGVVFVIFGIFLFFGFIE